MTDPRWSRSVPISHDALSSIIDHAPSYPQDLDIRQGSQTPYTLSLRIDPVLEVSLTSFASCSLRAIDLWKFDTQTSQYHVGSPVSFGARRPFPTFEYFGSTSPVGTRLSQPSSVPNASYNAEYPPLPSASTSATSLPYGFRAPQSQGPAASMAHGINYWSHQDQPVTAPLSYAQAIATTQPPPIPLQQRAQTFRLEHYINTEYFEDSPQAGFPLLTTAPMSQASGGQMATPPVHQGRSLDAAVQSMRLQIAGTQPSSNTPASPSVRSTGSRRSTLTQRSRRSSHAGRKRVEYKCHRCNKILPSRVKLE